jgi:hypothetical protein
MGRKMRYYYESEHELLRGALKTLHKTRGMGGDIIAKKSGAASSGQPISRFRDRKTRYMEKKKAEPLWYWCQDKQDFDFGPDPIWHEYHHSFFHVSALFFDVKDDRIENLSMNAVGQFRFYRYAQIEKGKVVCGRWDITFDDNENTVLSHEKLHCDHTIKGIELNETYSGYILQRRSNLIMFLRNTESQQPKLYVLHKSDFSETGPVNMVSGAMLEPKRSGGFFFSGVVGYRVSENERIDCNVMDWNTVPNEVQRNLRTYVEDSE